MTAIILISKPIQLKTHMLQKMQRQEAQTKLLHYSVSITLQCLATEPKQSPYKP